MHSRALLLKVNKYEHIGLEKQVWKQKITAGVNTDPTTEPASSLSLLQEKTTATNTDKITE